MCDPYESLAFPIDPTFRVLGRRWAAEVLFQVIAGTARYSQLQRALPGISPRTLSARVSEWESAGVISKNRRNHTERVYALTDKGRELEGVLSSIASLSMRWHTEISGARDRIGPKLKLNWLHLPADHNMGMTETERKFHRKTVAQSFNKTWDYLDMKRRSTKDVRRCSTSHTRPVITGA